MSIYGHDLEDTRSLNEDLNIPEIDYSTLLELAELGVTDFETFSINEGAIKDAKEYAEMVTELKRQWEKVASQFTMHKWIYRYIKDEKQEEMLHKWHDIICDPDVSYGQYKKAYNFFCQFFGIPNKGTIIEWFTFDNDKVDCNQKKIAIRYSRGLARVNIPDEMLLFHSSPTKDIKALNPAFKSKTQGKFFYPTNRVFFTVNKDINPFKFGLGKHKYLPIKDKNIPLYRYTPVNPIKVVYIDPTYSLRGEVNLRSVYVETMSPIPVRDITDVKKTVYGRLKEDTEYGDLNLDLLGEDVCMESLIQNKEMKELMKNWKVSNQDHAKKVFKSNTLSDEEYHDMFDTIDTMRTTQDFAEYKKAFTHFCNFCHIVPRGTIIAKVELHTGKTSNTNSIHVEYSYNTKKIKLPEGMKLYHFSKVEGIKELIPTFRSKQSKRAVVGKGYLYEKPRIYFTIHKAMPKFLADYKWYENIHKYECKLDIKEVYVDPLVWVGELQGAVYVETNKPIPVEEMGINKK